MRTRVDLHEALVVVLVKLGIREQNGRGHIYFQPPASEKMVYPAILYTLSGIPAEHADNRPYLHHKRYMVTAVDKNPDSRLPEELALLPTARFDRHYTSGNLNHWVFTITV